MPGTHQPIKIKVEGMACAHCVAAVERAVRTVPGAEPERVSVGEAVVRVNGPDAAAAVVSAIDDAGFQATVTDHGASQA